VQVMFRASNGTGISDPNQLPVFICEIHLVAVRQTHDVADTLLATDRHSISITLHTKPMNIACILHLLLHVSAATDRRLGIIHIH